MLTPFSDFKTTELPIDVINEYFVQPYYMDRIFTPNATFVEGQRGTGKTMLMRYIANNPRLSNGSLEYIGVYLRFDRFVYGIDLLSTSYEMFYHLLTITLLYLLTDRLQSVSRDKPFQGMNRYAKEVCRIFYDDATKENVNNFSSVLEYLESKRMELMKHLRNPKRVIAPIICDFGNGIARVVNAIKTDSNFHHTTILFLFDEFENLNCIQQQAINGMIKAAEPGFTYKVFYRPFGRESSRVLDSREYLKERDDYTVMNLYEDIIGGDEHFPKFTKDIIRQRLIAFYKANDICACEENLNIDNYLEKLSINDEFELLTSDSYISKVTKEIYSYLTPDNRILLSDFINSISKDLFKLRLFLSLLKKKAKSKNMLQPCEIAYHFQNNTSEFKNWCHNYKTAILYLVYEDNNRKRVVTGSDQIITISNGIIRYVLNILHYTFMTSSLEKHSKFSYATQTEAIRKVADIAYHDIINIPNVGGEVSELILYLGTLFKWYHKDDTLKKWETNHFTIKDTVGFSRSRYNKLQNVLAAAFTWGLLTTKEATKMKTKTDFAMKNAAYCLHPIFAVYFNISWRQKQKCEVDATELFDIVFSTQKTRAEIMAKQYKRILGNDSISSQLTMFNEEGIK